MSASVGRVLTAVEVLDTVPQRPPFRFIDEIVRIDEARITARCTYAPDAPFYGGHFPGMPVTPGVILLETMAQTGVVALGIYLKALEVGADELRAWVSVFTEAEVEFLDRVLPGETVTCQGEKIYWRRNKLKSKVEMTNESDRVVATATLAGVGMRRE